MRAWGNALTRLGLDKKYGKLTPEDFKSLFLLLPQLESERLWLQARIAEKAEEFVAKFLSSGFAWAHLYEIPFVEFLGRYLAVTGLDKQVSEAVAGDRSVEALFDLRDSSEEMEWSGGSGGQFTYGDLLGYLHALIGNLECLLIYGSYLNDLVAAAKEGNLKALLNAIRIDPSVVSGPTARYFISVAVIAGDQEFIDEVRKAMSGKTAKQSKYLNEFRLLMQILHELNELDRPTKEIMELVLDVGAYDTSGERGFTAEKNIRELILKAKAAKKNTISK